MANAARGEVTLTIDGQPYKLCLTLGALAELEDAFEVEDLGQFDKVLGKLNGKKLLTVVLALLHGGGHTDMTMERLRSMPVLLADATVAVNKALSVGSFKSADADGDAPAGP